MTVGDVNGDFKADVVAVDYHGICVLLGAGDGTFTASCVPFGPQTAQGQETVSAVISDVNGDGKPDILVSSPPNPSGGSSVPGVIVLLGNGDGSFQTPSSPYPAGGPNGLAVSDFSGDGIPDVAVLASDGSIGILLGNGDGSFQAPSFYDSGAFGFAQLVIGDFNGDGMPDIAATGYSSGCVALGTGPVLPTTTTLSATPQPSRYGQGVLLTADVTPSDAPGVVEFSAGAAILGYGSVSGSGRAQLTTAALMAGTNSIQALYPGVTGFFLPSQSAVVTEMVNTVAGSTFTAGATTTGTSAATWVAAADFNGDGKPDLAVANQGGSVSVLLGNGDGTFLAPVNYVTGQQPVYVVTGDFNRDGKTDLAVINAGDTNVSILLGHGDGTFQAAMNFQVGGLPQAAAIGDFNGDGISDLPVENSNNDVGILIGNGGGTFRSATFAVAGASPDGVTIGDFNGDSKADLAVVNLNGNDVSVFLGNGDGTFQAAVSFTAGSSPRSVIAGDFNADGKLDLAVTNFSGNNVSVLLGIGEGSFQPAVNYPAGNGPTGLVSGDFNGDGKPDLAVASGGSSAVTILRGNGDGTFQAPVGYPTASASNSVAIADFNGDGIADLATANLSTGGVSVLLGANPATKLMITQQPSSGTVGLPIGNVVVQVQNAFGNLLTASTAAVTIASTPAGVGGTLTVNAVGGVATFSNLVFNGANSYTLTASSTGLTPVGSTPIQITRPVMSLSQTILNFGSSGGVITDPQSVTVSFTGSAPAAWTASSNQSNVTVSPTSGTGLATLQITASAGPSAIVTVTAPGAISSPQAIQVNVASVTAGAPFGSFDTPVSGATGLAGSIGVTGWALDSIEVTGVDIWREPVAGEPASPGLILIGNATFVAGARPDVQALYPTTPFNYQAGWGYLLLSNELPNNGSPAGIGNGTYKIHAIAHNKSGNSLDLGVKTIAVNNAAATLPFGAIDTPGQGATVSGTVTNFGWALTPPAVGCPMADQPCMIPVNGSTLFVYVDGQSLGNPVYNLARCDVDQLFPGYANSGSTNCALNGTSPGPVGYFNLDTTQLANGVHTIAWSVTDNAGKAQGIGSRYFTVEN